MLKNVPRRITAAMLTKHVPEFHNKLLFIITGITVTLGDQCFPRNKAKQAKL